MPRAALFDLDRTLVRKEPASLYVRYRVDIGDASITEQALARVSSELGPARALHRDARERSLTTPEQSASALLEHLRTGGSGQIWDVA